MTILKKFLRIFLFSLSAFLVVILLVAGIIYLTTFGEYTVARTVDQNAGLPKITVKNYSFHSQAFGSRKNPVIIALHGGPGNDYRYILPLKGLANRYYVVFYDQRGSGLSPRVTPEKITMQSYLDDLNDIIDYYAGKRKVILIGHSWGAMLATAYTARHPDRVNKLVLAEPGILSNEAMEYFSSKVFKMPGPGFLLHLLKSRIKALHVSGPDEQAGLDYFYQEALYNYQGDDHPMKGYWCKGGPPANALTIWRFGGAATERSQDPPRDQQGNQQMNLANGIKKFTGKVLLLVGECSMLGEPWQKRFHLKLFSNVEMKVIKGSGHTMFGEKPAESLRFIRAYLNE